MDSYTESYMIKERSKYLNPQIDGSYCIGSKNECLDLVEEGYVRIPWGEVPSKEDYDKINRLILLPTASQLKKFKFPDFIKDLSQLQHLSIPFSLVTFLNKETIPASVKNLMLTNNYEHSVLFDDLKAHVFDPVFINFNALGFLGDYYDSGKDSLLNIDVLVLQNLEYLRCYIDKKGLVLEEIKKMKNLNYLELAHVYGFDIFEHIHGSLRILSITDTNKQFKIDHINRLTQLKILHLNGVKGEIDCSVFLDLPNLQEIIIHNSKKLKNVEKLLECKNLKSLEIVNCGTPLKKEGKALFQNHGFERLDIDYS
ncbi:hypothetical protein YDYSG_69270 [Paenibacillus tyrfis]|uniref:hypothetical protein n=1 Tax=Paenibacillus tyrfis TaxID=1501230 RepID=UPI0024926D5C|nr:hypothetical protein [Paenibacillus tyrfis]GLI10891.1 hypothetical protein YDYSG_69270 [Paenibacillus tyrfis]